MEHKCHVYQLLLVWGGGEPLSHQRSLPVQSLPQLTLQSGMGRVGLLHIEDLHLQTWLKGHHLVLL